MFRFVDLGPVVFFILLPLFSTPFRQVFTCPLFVSRHRTAVAAHLQSLIDAGRISRPNLRPALFQTTRPARPVQNWIRDSLVRDQQHRFMFNSCPLLSPSFPFCFLPFIRFRRFAPPRLMYFRFHFIYCTCIPAPRSAPSRSLR
jgi:hypothetical protein